jgi:hypothetical protein
MVTRPIRSPAPDELATERARRLPEVDSDAARHVPGRLT